MSFEVTFILNIVHSVVTILPLGLSSHGAFTFYSREGATDALVDCAVNFMTEKFGEMFDGLHEYLGSSYLSENVDKYVVMKSENCLNVYHIEERVVAGWLTNGKIAEPVLVGTFTMLEIPRVGGSQHEMETLRSELKEARYEHNRYNNRIIELEKENECTKKLLTNLENISGDKDPRFISLKNERNELEKTMNSLIKTQEELSADNRQLSKDLDEMYERSRSDFTSIGNLTRELNQLRGEITQKNMEINDLSRRLADRDREMVGLREDAVYAVRTRATPAKKTEITSSVYDSAIEQIRNFNKNSLMSREDRDALLAQKKEKTDNTVHVNRFQLNLNNLDTPPVQQITISPPAWALNADTSLFPKYIM